MSNTKPLITLLTDFGETGGYVGAMKGVMLSITPDARLVDISHAIDPQDVKQASAILLSVYPYFPPHTVHLIVVDPGVGTSRRAIALETPHGRFIAPDNGVLTHVLLHEPEWKAVSLDDPAYWRKAPSHTFHGRDIFSPAAAHLAGGVPLEKLGSPLAEPIRLDLPTLEITPTAIRGRVLRVDHFGNVLTDITQLEWADEDTIRFVPLLPTTQPTPPPFEASKARIAFSWHTLQGINHTYGEARAGQPLALVSSSGELEIAVNQGSAENKLGVKVGDTVTLTIER